MGWYEREREGKGSREFSPPFFSRPSFSNADRTLLSFSCVKEETVKKLEVKNEIAVTLKPF